MPSPKRKTTAADALSVLSTLTLTSFIVGMLYFAQDILIPLALAALLTFLLTPLVARIQRWVGRVVAILLVVTMIFAATGAVGWVLTRQLIDLATKLPDYKGNIVARLHTFNLHKGGAMAAFSKTVEELKQELPGGSGPDAAPTVTKDAGKPETAVISPAAPQPKALPVQVVEVSKASPVDLIRSLLEPLVGPLGTSALVVLLVIFMLFQQEDLRNRLIRLIGQGRISVTSRAMDDASTRVSRYLLMQLVVNVTYGIPVAIGLYFIGVPNAILWGGLATVLRFIPYVGPWIGAAIPILLSVAVSPSWLMPVLTIGLFVVLELVSNNVVEPWLYGTSTGVSSMALIVAAMFWTWLWGPVGLVLSTPLTVCLVVIGRHVPRLSFLGVLLSNEEALTPAEDCYHLLLTPGDHDEIEFVDSYLKANSLTSLYDTVFIPVIAAAEIDAREDSLDPDQLLVIEQSLRDIIQDLGTRPVPVAEIEADATPAPAPTPPSRVCCLPARAERDQLAGSMLAHLLQQQGCEAWSAPGKLAPDELLAFLAKSDVDVACISVAAPSTVIHARFLCLKVRAHFPRVKIVIGLWGVTEGAAESAKRLRDSGADEVVFSLADAVAHIARFAPAMDKSPSDTSTKGLLAAIPLLAYLLAGLIAFGSAPSAFAETKSRKKPAATETSKPAPKKKTATPTPSPKKAKPDAGPETSPAPSTATGPNASIAAEDLVEFHAQPAGVKKIIESCLEPTRQNLTYAYGSSDPKSGGLDCSGFIHYVLRQHGFTQVPRDSSGQYVWVRRARTFRAVISRKADSFEFDELLPGDLLFWIGTYATEHDPPVSHAMLYLGTEKSTGTKVMVGSSDGRTYRGHKRNGVSVFDFSMPRTPGNGDPRSTFIGYGRIPGVRD